MKDRKVQKYLRNDPLPSSPLPLMNNWLFVVGVLFHQPDYEEVSERHEREKDREREREQLESGMPEIFFYMDELKRIDPTHKSSSSFLVKGMKTTIGQV